MNIDTFVAKIIQFLLTYFSFSYSSHLDVAVGNEFITLAIALANSLISTASPYALIASYAVQCIYRLSFGKHVFNTFFILIPESLPT